MKAPTMGSIIVSIALVASACATEPTVTDPASVVQDFHDKINAGDLDGAMAYVPENASYFTFRLLEGKEQIREFYQMEIERNTRYELGDIEVNGNEVSYTLNIDSDVQKDVEWIVDAVVKDGMLISLRALKISKDFEAAA